MPPRRCSNPLVLAGFVLLFVLPLPAALGFEDRPSVIPAKPAGPPVSPETMNRVFAEAKTPFKYGIVVRGADHNAVDCPSVFRYRKNWYMAYVCMDKVGYETLLARSDDLLHWETLGKILAFRKTGWDAWQADGGIALQECAWGGSGELHAVDSKYWMSYLGGAAQGYEPDPLAIGLAWTLTPDQPRPWTRLARNPVLRCDQADARPFEKTTLYKSNVVYDKEQSLGYPFVMYYNGKIKTAYEKIGMAVSRDMLHWTRYSRQPVVANGEQQENGISGDPQVVKMDDVWVMFYFGAFWKPKAFDTFACSYDLVHWTKWCGPHLVAPSEPWDAQYAHKPWLLKHDGVVYHFYCAVGDQGRVIALATSKDLKKAAKR